MLYVSNLAKYATNRWTWTTTLSGISDGSYRYTGSISDLVGLSTLTGRTINIDTLAPTGGSFTINSNAIYTS